MSFVLHIETSSPVCSVCLSHNEQVIGIRESYDSNHAADLTVMIDEVFAKAGVRIEELNAVAVSSGPGSYTGLRIGAATAKGICYAHSTPLIAIDSLEALAAGMAQQLDLNNVLLLPSVDARRMEIYFALFGSDGEMLKPSTHAMPDNHFAAQFGVQQTIVIGGSAVSKCKSIFADKPRIFFDEKTKPSAKWMIRPALKCLSQQRFSDLFSFEPNYIKPPFITGVISE